MAVAHVHVRSWQVGYRHLLPAAYLDQLRPEDRARRYTFGDNAPDQPQTMVAIEANTIRGFATIATVRDNHSAHVGELCALYVHPDYWQRGIGKALVSTARSRLFERGCTTAVLWLLKGNSRGDAFYRGDGWIPDGTERSDVVWGIAIDEVRYQRALSWQPAPG